MYPRCHKVIVVQKNSTVQPESKVSTNRKGNGADIFESSRSWGGGGGPNKKLKGRKPFQIFF